MLRQNVLVELEHFVEAVIAYRTNQKKLKSLIRASLHLLEDLPAGREILFDYFKLIAELSVQNYVANANVDTQTGLPLPQKTKGAGKAAPTSIDEDENFFQIQEALENLVSNGPPAWNSIIASWSLDLVGSLSDKYSKRKMTIGAACNFWLNCNTMRGLLTLISGCFRKLNNTEAESYVEALLISYQRYSLSFDWIVARLGGCFPLKIISQILQYSLKRFADDFRCQFDSEIGILEYLSFVHEQELKTALREMLQEGFQPKKSLDASIIPFLMVISNYSDQLLQNLVNVFLEMYNDDLRATILQKAPLWMSNKLFAEIQPSLNNIALRLSTHGTTLLIMAAKMAGQFVWCQDFLEFSLQELEQVILNARLCPLIDDLAAESTKYMLWNSCLSTNVCEQQTAVRLLLIVSAHHSHIYYQTISELLRKSYEQNENGLGAVIRILGGQSGLVEFPEVMAGVKMVLEDVLLNEQLQRSRITLSSESSEAYNTFKNLNRLTKMQANNSFQFMRNNLMTNTLNACLPQILQILDVTVTKLLLSMNRKAAESYAEKLKESEYNNNNTVDLYAPKIKKQKMSDKYFEIKMEDKKKTTSETLVKKLGGCTDEEAVRLALSHTMIEDCIEVRKEDKEKEIGESLGRKLVSPNEDEEASRLGLLLELVAECFEVQKEQKATEIEEIRVRKLSDRTDNEEARRLSLVHTVIDLLNTIEAGAKGKIMRTTEVLKLSVLSVRYFFISLTEKNPILRSSATNRIFKLLERQCASRKSARTACLRELIEGSLFYYGYLFGQYEEPEVDEMLIPKQEMVLLQNQRHSVGPNANRTILHAGLIGRGLRPGSITSGADCDAQLQILLLKALDACCTDDKLNATEGYSMISLMLVEMVSSDVMYNGLPFPDEDFTKVTMERDLLIRRAFITSPILWALLSFIASHRPALCFSSVLLRALCATCLHQWRAKNINRLQPHNPNDELLQCTKKLLQILAMGQLLPAPLSNLHLIIQCFEPSEIALLLKECVWNYLKDHVPSPALFQIDSNGLHWRNPSLSHIPPQYVDPLRNLMQKKLAVLGPHYHQMFVMSEMNSSASDNIVIPMDIDIS